MEWAPGFFTIIESPNFSHHLKHKSSDFVKYAKATPEL